MKVHQLLPLGIFCMLIGILFQLAPATSFDEIFNSYTRAIGLGYFMHGLGMAFMIVGGSVLSSWITLKFLHMSEQP